MQPIAAGHVTTVLVQAPGRGLAALSLNRPATSDTIAKLKDMLAEGVDLIGVVERTQGGEIAWVDRSLSSQAMQRCLSHDYNLDDEAHRETLASKKTAAVIQSVKGRHRWRSLQTTLIVSAPFIAGLAFLSADF